MRTCPVSTENTEDILLLKKGFLFLRCHIFAVKVNQSILTMVNFLRIYQKLLKLVILTEIFKEK